VNERPAMSHSQSARPSAWAPSHSVRAVLAHCTLAERPIEFQLENAVALSREALQATAICPT
jgi:hypothetical protein